MPSVSAILKAVQHPTRRLILTMIHETHEPIQYSAMLHLCGNSTGKLNYHLRSLNEIIVKQGDGYILNEKGEKIVGWLENIVSMGDKPDTSKPSVIFARIFPDKAFFYKGCTIVFILGLILLLPSFGMIYFSVSAIPLLISIILISLGVLIVWWYYSTIWYQITDTEVVVHKGIITKTQKIVPYRTITNVEIKRGIFDRMFNIGTVDIHTAGSSRLGAEEGMVGIVDTEEIKETVLERIRLLNPPDFASSNQSVEENSPILHQIQKALHDLNEDLKGHFE
ncbi:MAG: PH domain-containing protein [Candidatus Kariarchaeaceae archaeon]|jgi:membrane protein YdbS with pleckstrin-like domain